MLIPASIPTSRPGATALVATLVGLIGVAASVVVGGSSAQAQTPSAAVAQNASGAGRRLNHRVEVLVKRSLDSKTFINEDGTYTTEISAAPIHYRDAAGQWLDIEPGFRRRAGSAAGASAESTGGYEVTRGLYQVRFDGPGASSQATGQPSGIGYRFTSPSGAELRARLTAMVYFDRSSKRLVPLQSVQSVAAVGDGDVLRYPDVLGSAVPGVSVRYRYTPTMLKEDVLLSPQARAALPDAAALGLHGADVYLGFVTEIEPDSTLDAVVGGVLVNGVRQSGASGRLRDRLGRRSREWHFEGEEAVEFRHSRGAGNASGNPAASPAAFLLPVDHAYSELLTDGETAGGGNRSNGARSDSSVRVLRRFYTDAEGRQFVLSAVPLRWIERQAAERTVVIDPQVAIQPSSSSTQDTYVQEGVSSTLWYYSTLYVGRNSYGINRGLLRFNLNSIPGLTTTSGALIDPTVAVLSAECRLTADAGFSQGFGLRLSLYQMKHSWSESSVNWTSTGTYGSWVTPGVGTNDQDAARLPADTQTWTSYLPVNYDVSSLVRLWLATPTQNNGVLIKADNETASSSMIIASSNHSTASYRPMLVITYAQGGEVARYSYNSSGTVSSLRLGGDSPSTNNGVVTGNFTYDDRDRLRDIAYTGVTGQALLTNHLDYMPNGNIESVQSSVLKAGSAAGVTTSYDTDQLTYTYDGRSQLLAVTSSLSASTRNQAYSYDQNGNIRSKTVGASQSTSVDPITQRLKTTVSGGTVSSYVYDTGTNNRPNRLMSVGGTAYGRAYSYDANGNVIADGRTTGGARTLEYDALNQLTKATRAAYGSNPAVSESYLYDAAGQRVRTLTCSGCQAYSNTFDNAAEVQSGTNVLWTANDGTWQTGSAVGNTLQGGVAGGYSDLGKLFLSSKEFTAEFTVQITDRTMPSANWQDGWNWFGFKFRLDDPAADYGHGYLLLYSATGQLQLLDGTQNNRTVAPVATAPVPTTTPQHVMVKAVETTYLNQPATLLQVWVGGQIYMSSYDTDVNRPGAQTSRTAYHFGFRTQSVKVRVDDLTVGSGMEDRYEVRGGTSQVLAEYDGRGTLLAEYIYGAGGQRLAKMEGTPVTTTANGSGGGAGGLVFYLNDQLGSARALTMDGQTTSWSASYQPFGEIASEQAGSDVTRFDFTGQARDRSTGLMYYGARYYDPEVGRFLSVDPAGEYASAYVYVGNSPLILTDPTGMSSESPIVQTISTRYFDENQKLVYDDGIDNGLDVYTNRKIIENHTSKGVIDWDGVRNDRETRTKVVDQQKYFRWVGTVLDQVYAAFGRENLKIHFDNKGNISFTTTSDALTNMFAEYAMSLFGGEVLLRAGNISLRLMTRSGSYVLNAEWKVWAKYMAKQGWSYEDIARTISRGESVPYINGSNWLNPNSPRLLYTDPMTGKKLVLDAATREVIQLGKSGHVW